MHSMTTQGDIGEVAQMLIDFPTDPRPVAMLRRMLSIERNAPIAQVVASGVIPHVIAQMNPRNPNSEIIFEAAWVITNIGQPSSRPLSPSLCGRC
jgi:hypothetical protein